MLLVVLLLSFGLGGHGGRNDRDLQLRQRQPVGLGVEEAVAAAGLAVDEEVACAAVRSVALHVEVDWGLVLDVEAVLVDVELLNRVDQVLVSFIFSDLRPDFHFKWELGCRVVLLRCSYQVVWRAVGWGFVDIGEVAAEALKQVLVGRHVPFDFFVFALLNLLSLETFLRDVQFVMQVVIRDHQVIYFLFLFLEQFVQILNLLPHLLLGSFLKHFLRVADVRRGNGELHRWLQVA